MNVAAAPQWGIRRTVLRSGALLGAWLLLAAATTPPRSERVVTSLADAAMRGEMSTVRTLIAQKANVNAAQGDGMTALHWAADRGDAAMTELLLRAGAKVSATTRIGANTPLHVAARNGRAAVVKALLAAGADPNALTVGGATALHLAAASSSADAVAALIAKKADINAREFEWGQTPLMFAANANRADAIKVLLQNHADANILTKTVDLQAQNARETAQAKKRNDVLLSYLPEKMRDSLKAAAAKNAAAAAAGRGGAGGGGGGIVDPLAAGAAPTPAQLAAFASRGPPDAPPTQTLTATQIQDAITAGRALPNAGPKDSLAPRGADVILPADTADGRVAGFAGTVGSMGGLSALHHAVRQGNIAAAMALLDGGANINERSAGDSTSPLLMATINGQFDLALKLVQRGADVKLSSTPGLTPLYAAINTEWLPRSRFPQPQSVQNQKTTHLELMDAIIKAGADVNVRLKKNLWFFAYDNCGNANCGLEMLDGTSPFWRAAYAVDVDAMRLLKAHGADVNVPSTRPAGRGGRGGAGGAGGFAAAGAAAGAGAAVAGDTTTAAAGATVGGGGRGGRGGGRGGAGGGAGGAAGLAALFEGIPAPPSLDPAMDSASKAFPAGTGVYPIHSAAGVGYGNGFAGNSHRHAPDGWMPAMKYLVEELGADVNQRDLNGYTPMHHAAARGDNEMILYLVSKGADPKAVARNGRTTVDMANGPVQRLRPFPETIALLEKLGAKNSHRCVGC